jgi:acetylornithine/N-succinyldiaminopimelate aminotransferase
VVSSQNDFLKYLAPTSPSPISLDVVSAKGVWLKDRKGKKYMDLISGVSVSNIGHGNPAVTKAIKAQLSAYSHLMVYGEFIQSPQVNFAKTLCRHLPPSLNSVYFVNSGSEAVEGALKLAKRYTGRREIIAFRGAYHGSTHGALSVMGDEKLKNPFRPLLPGIKILPYNDKGGIHAAISKSTCCVIAETIQGENGVRIANADFLRALRNRCHETGALLILDEVQTGMGRTGKLFAFEDYAVTPDILIAGKALGGGLPLGAFIAERKVMQCLSVNPPFGHITTFGGHPLSCASGLAALQYVLDEKLMDKVMEKEKLFRKLLVHPTITAVRGKGLLLSLQFKNEGLCKKVINGCLKNGIIAEWFLFCESAMRIYPPMTITNKEIKFACSRILESINKI